MKHIFYLGSMSCIFPLSKLWQSYSSKTRRQVQGQGKMDFRMYLPQAQEHWLPLYNWGLHLRQLSWVYKVLLLSSSVCTWLRNVVVIHQQMDGDYEVTPILKSRGRTTSDPTTFLSGKLIRSRVCFMEKLIIKKWERNCVCVSGPSTHQSTNHTMYFEVVT